MNIEIIDIFGNSIKHEKKEFNFKVRSREDIEKLLKSKNNILNYYLIDKKNLLYNHIYDFRLRLAIQQINNIKTEIRLLEWVLCL